MDSNCWKTSVWEQFGGAIDMLENAVHACPDPLWGDQARNPQYWYLMFHTLFFLDYYLEDSEVGFAPPAPFGLTEMDPAGVLPERVYSKAELLAYLEHGRLKCRTTIAALTDDGAARRCGFQRREISVLGLLLYNMRHVQHHAAQLNLILRQTVDSAPGWVGKARVGLTGD